MNYKMQGAADSTYITTLKIDLGGAIGSKPLTLKVFTSNTIEQVLVNLHSEHQIQINDTNMYKYIYIYIYKYIYIYICCRKNEAHSTYE